MPNKRITVTVPYTQPWELLEKVFSTEILFFIRKDLYVLTKSSQIDILGNIRTIKYYYFIW